MSLTVIHARVATTMMLFCFIAALWGIVQYLRGRTFDGSYWGVLVIAELVILVQAVLGLVLWAQGALPARGIHILYGAVAALTLPAIYAFSGGRDDKRMALGYGLVLLFLVGISWRAMITGA